MSAAEYPFESRYFSRNGHWMHYVDEGTGPVLVCLHGNPTWSYYWRRVISELRDRYRVIAPDHLGCGLSDKPQDYPYRLADHVGNVTALLDHLAVKDVTLVLHDWGGAIGMGYGAVRPENVRRLVLLNTAAFRSKDLPRRLAFCRLPVLGELAIRGFNGFARAATWMATEKGLSPEVRRQYLLPYDSYRNRIATHRFVVDIPMSPAHPSWDTLKEIEKALPKFADRPAALIWGGKDWVFHRSFFDEWQRRLPHAEAHWIEEAGHYVMEDAGEPVLRLLSRFLGETDHVC